MHAPRADACSEPNEKRHDEHCSYDDHIDDGADVHEQIGETFIPAPATHGVALMRDRDRYGHVRRCVGSEFIHQADRCCARSGIGCLADRRHE